MSEHQRITEPCVCDFVDVQGTAAKSRIADRCAEGENHDRSHKGQKAAAQQSSNNRTYDLLFYLRKFVSEFYLRLSKRHIEIILELPAFTNFGLLHLLSDPDTFRADS